MNTFHKLALIIIRGRETVPLLHVLTYLIPRNLTLSVLIVQTVMNFAPHAFPSPFLVNKLIKGRAHFGEPVIPGELNYFPLTHLVLQLIVREQHPYFASFVPPLCRSSVRSI